MGTVYAIANQKGGVGKTTTAVNVAACIAEAGYETLLVDVDPQGNATVGLGVSRDERPRPLRRPGRRRRRPPTPCARPTIERLSMLVLDARTSPARRWSCRGCRAPRAACATRSTRSATRYAFMLLDCPPSLGPLTVNALVAADRVIVPVQTEYFALEGLAGLLDTLGADPARAQPAADGRRDAADDARRAHEARARTSSARCAQHFPAARLRHRDPAQRPARRGAELRRAPSSITIRTAPARRPTSSWPRRWPPVAERHARHGPRPRGDPARPPSPRRGRARRPGAAPAPGRADLAQPAPAAAARSTRRRCSRWPSRSRERGVLQPVLVRPLAGRHLRADRRRAPLARRAARRASTHVPARRRARTTTRESLELALIENMAREDLNPVEEARACALLVEELGLTREEVGRRVGRSRVAVSNLLRLLDLPDEVLDLLADGDAHRGPRPRAADGRATTPTAAGSPAPPPTRAGRSAHRGRGPRAARRRAATPAPRRARAAARSTPTRPRPPARLGDALGRALGADVQVAPRGRRLQGHAGLRLARRGDGAGRAARRRRARLSAHGRYHRAAAGD